MNRALTRTIVLSLVILAAAPAWAQQTRMFALPTEPLTAIFDAFGSHQIVALGEGNHTNEQGHGFRLALIRDHRFAETVNDILVEFGSDSHQDLLDRFIRGDDVSLDQLRLVLRTPRPGGIWDKPIYENFFLAVRDVNASLPKERQLRVLLADPPNGSIVEILRREVLAKNRKALIVYGDGHLDRGGTMSIVERLESAGTKVFTIHSNVMRHNLEHWQPTVAKWPIPSLARIRGTIFDWKGYGSFDALLYLGHPLTLTYSHFTQEQCSDPEYIRLHHQNSEEWQRQCVLPDTILPQLWKTYDRKGIAATLAMMPSSPAAYRFGSEDLFKLAEAVMVRGKAKDALAILEKNLQVFPGDPQSVKALAEAKRKAW